MTKRTDVNVKLFIILVIVFAITAFCFGSVANTTVAKANYTYGLTAEPLTTDVVNATDGVTYRFYVNSTGYQYITKITYTIYKLNYLSDVDNLTAYAGKITNKGYETPIEGKEDVVVEKNDLIASEAFGEKYAYYFDIKLNTVCAIVPIVYYQISSQDAEQMVYDDIVYCTKVDDVAPSVKYVSAIFAEGACVITVKLTEETSKAYPSGLSKAIVYKKGKNSDEYEQIATKDVTGVNYTYSIEVEYGNFNYYVVALDKAGNESEKVLVKSLTDSSYDVTTESEANLALVEMNKGGYAKSIIDLLSSAYANYITVISDADSTENQKGVALSELKSALNVYYTAKSNKEKGVIDCEIDVVNEAYLDRFTVKNVDKAVAFLDAGDSATLTLTLAEYKYSKIKDKIKDEQQELNIDNVEEVYQITLALNSIDKGKVVSDFSSPIVLEFYGKGEREISAIQTVYRTNGEKEFYECLITSYVDDKVTVTAQKSGGVITIFMTDNNDFDSWWLLSLAVIPLAIGVVLVVYAKKKLKNTANKNVDNIKEK